MTPWVGSRVPACGFTSDQTSTMKTLDKLSAVIVIGSLMYIAAQIVGAL